MAGFVVYGPPRAGFFVGMAFISKEKTMQSQRLEKIPQAASRMGISLTQVYREIKQGRLGPLVKLGPRASAVPAEAVDSWIAARIAEAKGGTQ